MIGKVCVFSTADDGYALKSAVSLLSVREKADVDLFIVGKHFTNVTKSILASYKIECVEINLDNDFGTSWGYPIECYYVFAGPRIFIKKGYQYSIYIDGDILCNADPLAPLNNGLRMFAGVSNGRIVDILQADLEKITKKWQVVPSDSERLQTGVLYFNNKAVDAINFLELISEIYNTSIAIDAPRKGDDSLFALFQMLHPVLSYKFLDRRYNYIQREQERDQIVAPEQVTFFHFTGVTPKPWADDDIENIGYMYFSDKWRELAESTVNNQFIHVSPSQRL